MAKKFLVPIDLAKNELQNAVLQVLGADPSTPPQGQFYFSSASDRPRFRGASAWLDLTDRALHSGTQLAATISDFATAVQVVRLDQMASPTAAVSMNNQRLTGLGTPTADTDAATKGYVDTALAAAANVSVLKGQVRAVVDTNVSLAAPGATLDGVTAVVDDVFLLVGQTTGSQNGPYVWNGAAVPMTRAANWDTTGEAELGSYWIVREGIYSDRFALLSNDTFTLGSTTATFVYTGAGTAYSAGAGILLSGTVISVDSDYVARKFAALVGTGASTSIAVTHSLNTLDVQVQVYEVATGDTVECDVTRTSTSQVTLGFAVAPATNALRVVVQG